jgi:hypothetical protein
MRLMVGSIVAVCVLYSISRWLILYGFIPSIIRGVFVGVILAGLAWLIARGAQRFRVKSPGPMAAWAGRIVYWIGCALGLYSLGLAIYATIYAVKTDKGLVAIQAISLLISIAISYWGIGRVIRYMLGR